MIVGVDEAGCGPAFGDLVASAVILPDNCSIEGLADSKKLTNNKRNALFKKITSPENNCAFGIGAVSNIEIDTNGLAWARRVVFHRALDDLEQKGYLHSNIANIIVDGNIFKEWKNVKYECIIKADEKIPCVSAASIVAKVTRDMSILKLCEEFPDLVKKYKLDKNKGYLTKDHVNGIRTHGLTDFHRKSYNIRL